MKEMTNQQKNLVKICKYQKVYNPLIWLDATLLKTFLHFAAILHKQGYTF